MTGQNIEAVEAYQAVDQTGIKYWCKIRLGHTTSSEHFTFEKICRNRFRRWSIVTDEPCASLPLSATLPKAAS